jgi:NAD(P)-dependent dehydrogenase (short-subunit alcohol dehydrogenase family)
MNLRGKVALITGGASPIGQATATALAGAGAKVVLHYRKSKAEAERAARKIGGLAIPGTLPQDADSIVTETVRRLGRLDVLVNNASYIDRRLDGGLKSTRHGVGRSRRTCSRDVRLLAGRRAS